MEEELEEVESGELQKSRVKSKDKERDVAHGHE